MNAVIIKMVQVWRHFHGWWRRSIKFSRSLFLSLYN